MRGRSHGAASKLWFGLVKTWCCLTSRACDIAYKSHGTGNNVALHAAKLATSGKAAG